MIHLMTVGRALAGRSGLEATISGRRPRVGDTAVHRCGLRFPHSSQAGELFVALQGSAVRWRDLRLTRLGRRGAVAVVAECAPSGRISMQALGRSRSTRGRRSP